MLLDKLERRKHYVAGVNYGRKSEEQRQERVTMIAREKCTDRPKISSESDVPALRKAYPPMRTTEGKRPETFSVPV